MRAVVQRVGSARVEVGDRVVGEMGAGLLALVAVGHADDDSHAQELARKLVGLRVFEDDAGRMNRSLRDTGGQLGLVSQFTLFGDLRRGLRPSFNEAAPPERAAALFDAVVAAARAEGAEVVTGEFRAKMRVALVNDGPVTVMIDTEKRF